MNHHLLTVTIKILRRGCNSFLEYLAYLVWVPEFNCSIPALSPYTQVCIKVLKSILKMDILIELIASRMNYAVFIFVLFCFALFQTGSHVS